MKVVSYTEHGKASEVLEVYEVDDPCPEEGDVLIKMESSGVNPSDVKARSGALWPMTCHRTIPHNDGAGVIVSVGKSVDSSRVGERVWTYNVNRTPNGLEQGANGTCCEYVAIKSRFAVPLPASVSFIEGACLGVPAMTAYVALFSDGPIENKSVLVTGGAGSVGMMAIQLAKWAGVKNIIATVSSDLKAKAAKAAGANETINYKQITSLDLFANSLLDINDGKPFHRIVDVDFGFHIGMISKTLRPGGVISAYASMSTPRPSFDFYPIMMNGATLRLIEIYAQNPNQFGRICKGLNAALADNVIKPMVNKVYNLQQTVEAHEAVEAGRHIGNIVIKL